MTNSQFQVRGHIWGIAVREGNMRRPGTIFIELHEVLDQLPSVDFAPWQKAIEGADERGSKIDLALERLDDLLTWGLIEKCDKELREIDLSKVAPSVLLTLLTGASARSDVLPYWDELVQKVEEQLLIHKNGNQGLVDSLMIGLRGKGRGPTITELTASFRGETVVIPD
jgi:hypothetical protein